MEETPSPGIEVFLNLTLKLARDGMRVVWSSLNIYYHDTAVNNDIVRDKNIPQALDAARQCRAMTNELADSRLFASELWPRYRLVVNSDNNCGMQLPSRWGARW